MADPNLDGSEVQRLLDRAAACRDRGDWAGAIALDRSAICLDPVSAMAYGSLAQSLRGADRLVAACQAWERSIELRVGQPYPRAIAHWELGKIRWELGEQDEAISQFLKAVAEDPRVIALRTLDDLSRWLRRRNRLAEAQLLEQASLKRLIPEVRHLIGQDNEASAIHWCLRTLQIDPACNSSYNLLFEALTALNRHQDAQNCLYRLVPDPLLDEFAPDLLQPIDRLPLISNETKGLKQLMEWSVSDPSIFPEPKSILRDRPVATFENLDLFGRAPRHCWAIENGRVWVDSFNRVFWNRDGAVIDGLMTGVDRLIASSKQLPSPQLITGTVAVIAKPHASNYFHWITEFLPQIIDFLDFSKATGQPIDYWYFDVEPLPFQTQSLEALGIAREQCISNRDIPHLQADRILAFNFSGIIEFYRHSLQSLRDRFLPRQELINHSGQSKDFPKRLYLKRSHTRRVLNENELYPILKEWNFELVPEGLSFTDQITLFSNAQTILGPHGAALTNMVWCQDKTKVLEFFAPSYTNHCYWRLSSQLDFSYHYLIGDAIPRSSNSPTSKIGFYHDLKVPLTVLARALEHWLS